MSSAFEYYFPPLFRPLDELSKEDKECYKKWCNLGSVDLYEFLVVSSRCIGAVIGRCGKVITRIRSESGATIRISGECGDKSRCIMINGSVESVRVARVMIMSCVERKSANKKV